MVNYHPDYSSESANLFYILGDTNGRYSKGNYYVLEDSGTYICSAGWNEYELDSDIALALTRAYVSPAHRGHYPMGVHILPEIVASTRMYKHLYITVNKYNSAISRWFSRSAAGKSGGIGTRWPNIYHNFKPAGVKTIYYTEQYVMEYQP
jgi:hypothetical protein